MFHLILLLIIIFLMKYLHFIAFALIIYNTMKNNKISGESLLYNDIDRVANNQV